MSSKNSRLFALLSQYNTFMWDIVRAYRESDLVPTELIKYLVEHDVNLSSNTILTYRTLYNKLIDQGYDDNVIDKKTPKQWLTYMKKKEREEK